MQLQRSKIKKIEISEIKDEYVYDIVMKDSSHPYYFGDDILVHNSCYFKTYGSDKEDAIQIANDVADYVNSTFKDFMSNAFLCDEQHSGLMKAAREVVGSRSLFQAKKKYIIRVVDLDGKPVDKLKTMGSEIKKSDTPKPIQQFLKDVVWKILDGQSYSEIETFVNDTRRGLFKKINRDDLLLLGVSKQVNNLDKFYTEFQNVELPGKGRAKLPGHVRAAINYNEEAKKHEGNGAELIRSGEKIRIFYLKDNPNKYTTMAFPAGKDGFPKWFIDEFDIDTKLTEEKMVDAKLKGIFSALGWDVPTFQRAYQSRVLVF